MSFETTQDVRNPLAEAVPLATSSRGVTNEPRTPVWRFRFACTHVFFTYLLLIAGGLVTSLDAGLSVPDWPTSYGNWVFVQWIGNVRYEHGHRMIASFVGLLTIVYAVWLWRSEQRRWLRWWGVGMLFAVCVQGLLGGLTVLHFLPPQISATHGTLAQTFFCMSVAAAYFVSDEWRETRQREASKKTRGLRRACWFAVGAVYVQLILGAVVRHAGAVLGGEESPPLTLENFFSDPSLFVHGFHWIGALTVLVALSHLLHVATWNHRKESFILRPVAAVFLLVLLQIGLGLWTVLSQTAPRAATSHVVIGALLLGSLVFVLLRSFREPRGGTP